MAMSTENILAMIALFFAVLFALFGFLIAFVTLSHSLDDTQRMSKQDDVMFSLAYQFLSFYNLILVPRINDEDVYQVRIIVQQLADMKHVLSKCVNLRLWEEVRGETPDSFYAFLKVSMLCDQKIESRSEDFTTFLRDIMTTYGGFRNFCMGHMRVVFNLVHDYNVAANERYSKKVFRVIQYVNRTFLVRPCLSSYGRILEDLNATYVYINNHNNAVPTDIPTVPSNIVVNPTVPTDNPVILTDIVISP